MFTKAKNMPAISSRQRVVLMVGGGGVLGTALLAQKPEDVFFINVSRRSAFEGPNVLNFHADVTSEPERIFRDLARTLPSVDVFVYAPYSHGFSSVKDLDLEKALEEYRLNVLSAAVCTKLCGNYFWSKEARSENMAQMRKAVWISSAASFGKTQRPELATYGATKAALNVLAAYTHDFLLDAYGVSALVLAPGSLRDSSTRKKMVTAFWTRERAPQEGFLIEKII